MVYKSIKSITRNGRRGIRRWLTKSQMLNVFDTAEIVDSIIARKETDEHLRSTEVREHPDCPGTGGCGVSDSAIQLFRIALCCPVQTAL